MSHRYDNEVVLTPPFLETVYRRQQAPVTVLKQEVMNQERREQVLEDIAHRVFAALYRGVVEFPTLEISAPQSEVTVPTRFRVRSYTKLSRTNLLVPELGEKWSREAVVDVLSPYPNISADIQLGSLMLHGDDNGESVQAVRLARRGETYEEIDMKPGASSNIEADQFASMARSYALYL